MFVYLLDGWLADFANWAVCKPGLSNSVGTIGFSNLDYFEFLELINILKFRHTHFSFYCSTHNRLLCSGDRLWLVLVNQNLIWLFLLRYFYQWSVTKSIILFVVHAGLNIEYTCVLYIKNYIVDMQGLQFLISSEAECMNYKSLTFLHTTYFLLFPVFKLIIYL